jgi:hypothetical protein
MEYNDNDSNDTESLLSETTSYEDISSITSQDSDYLEDMFVEDHVFNETEKQDEKYYIGLCRQLYNNDHYLLTSAITPSLFLRSTYQNSLQYLIYNSIIVMNQPFIEIMKLHIYKNNTYTVVKKTFWLRLIQRRWKKIIKARYEINRRRGFILSQNTFSIYGKYPYELRTLPSLKGMMWDFTNK